MSQAYAAFDERIDDPNSNKKALFEEMLKKFEQGGSTDLNYCYRLVKVCIMIADGAEKDKNKAEAKKYIEKSFDLAKKGVQLGPNSMDAHKWYCASVGRMSSLVGTKERIKFGHEFKEHRDIAVSIDSNDMIMHHMYGRWCYEVASLTYLERKIAETFFATPPKATYEDALESIKLADQLRHEWKLNHLWMAKTLIALKKYDQAIKWIDSGLALPNVNEEDAVSHQELEGLEKSYMKYRPKR